ncbi:MAG: hypothetical protein HY881_14440 [Deltaproteobacteria bacterium]|nr:hypothetical protein [Deltaproteobacteria bacterium]
MQQCNEPIQQQPIMFSIRELTEIIIKKQKMHDGLYNLSIEFQIAVGAIGQSPETVFPGAMFGVSRVGISRTDPDKKNIHTVDASEVNPLVKPVPKKKKITK